MLRRSLTVFSLALGLGLVGLACSSGSSVAVTATDGGETGDFGCCPDVKTACTLYRYGKKTSASDTCIVGYDGVVPDPTQPGWTRGTDENGCPFWAPPPDAARIMCGAPRPDGGVDASDGAADASDGSDVDASDASSE